MTKDNTAEEIIIESGTNEEEQAKKDSTKSAEEKNKNASTKSSKKAQDTNEKVTTNKSKKSDKSTSSTKKVTAKNSSTKLTAKGVAKARKKITKQAKLDEQQPTHNIKHLLDDDEQVVLTRTPHRKSYLGAAITSVICGILSLAAINAIVLYFMLNDGVSKLDITFLVLIGILDLVAIILCFKYSIFALFGVDNIEYVFTNKRIIISRGISTIHFDILNYQDIESVRLKIGPIDKMFSVGDIYIHTKKRLVIVFDIHDSKHIMDKLNKLIVKSK